MPCFGLPIVAAGLAIEQARAAAFGVCVVYGPLTSARLTGWVASANGVEVADLGQSLRPLIGDRWAQDWAAEHTEPEPVSLPEAVEALSPGLLVVVRR